MDRHEEERNELAQDEEKLQIALSQVANENGDWYDYDDDDDEEDDDQLLIDLEAPSDITAQSTSSGYVESGSRTQFMTIDEDSQERRNIPGIPSLEETSGSAAEKTLALNRALQGILESRIESIEAAIEINKEKQSRLNAGTWAELEGKKGGKGKTWGPFRSPFFQCATATSFPPDNEDTILKRQSNELPFNFLHEHMNYNKSTKRRLLEAITDDTREWLIKPIMNRFEAEVKKEVELRRSVDEKLNEIAEEQKRLKTFRGIQSKKLHMAPSDKRQNKRDIKKCERVLERKEEEHKKALELQQEQEAKVGELEMELNAVKSESRESILNKVDSSKVDWMKMSKQWFKEGTSWLDCLKAWDFIANPKINIKPWTPREQTELLKLVKKYKGKEWETVAEKLGTGRTPFHCFFHYQKHNPEFKSRPWKKEEDYQLSESVKKLRMVSSNFSWRKIAAMINGRSSFECMTRFKYIDTDRKSGRWDKMEDARLIMAVNLLGKNWKKVSKFMGKRTHLQCFQRYSQCLNPELNFFHFTYEDDKKLLTYYKKWGPRWAKIVKHFSGRTDGMLKARYSTLMKWQKETDWFNKQTKSAKDLLLGKNLTVNERHQFEDEWKSFTQVTLGVKDKDYVEQEKDRGMETDPEIIPPRPPMHLKYTRFQKCFTDRKKQIWSKRLNLHHRLLENLKTRFEEEQQEKKDLKNDKDSSKKAVCKAGYSEAIDEVDLNEKEIKLKEAMDRTLEQTSQDIIVPKHKMASMMSALNKHFLGETNINVSEILKATHSEKPDTLRKAHRHRKRVNMRLKKILSKNKWIFFRNWRCSENILPPDEREKKDLEKERRESGKYVSGLMMRRLGGDSVTLTKVVREKLSTVREKKVALKHFTSDPNYKKKSAIFKGQISELQNLTHLSDELKEKHIGTVNRREIRLRREFNRDYKLKREMMHGVEEGAQKDSDYLETMAKYPLSTNDAFQKSSLTSSSDMENKMDCSEQHEGGDNVVYKSLSHIPPCLTTLSALRLLLLHRKQLMDGAGKLYDPIRYQRKRKQRLHIILDSDDEENPSATALDSKRRKKDGVQASLRTIEVVEEEEAKFTDSWFKSEENVIEVDKDLEKIDHLTSASFEPYSGKRIPGINRPHIAHDPMEELNTLEKKSIHLGIKLEQQSTGTTYEIMVAPSVVVPSAPLDEEVCSDDDDTSVHKTTYSSSSSNKIQTGNETSSPTATTNQISSATASVSSANDVVSPTSKRRRKSSADKEVPRVQNIADKGERERVIKAVNSLKRTSTKDDLNLKNVVVVGLDFQNKKVNHYKADDRIPISTPIVCEENASVASDFSEISLKRSGRTYVSNKPVDNSLSQGNSHVPNASNMLVNNDGLKKSSAPRDSYMTSMKSDPDLVVKDLVSASKMPVEASAPGGYRTTSLQLGTEKNGKDTRKLSDNGSLTNESNIASLSGQPKKDSASQAKGVGDSGDEVIVESEPSSGQASHCDKSVEPPADTAAECQPTGQNPGPKLEDMSEHELMSCMAAVRETEQYQRLVARFRALFLWPVLMSTTKPNDEVKLVKVEPGQDEEEEEPIARNKACKRPAPAAVPQEPVKRGRGRPKKLGKKKGDKKKKKKVSKVTSGASGASTNVPTTTSNVPTATADVPTTAPKKPRSYKGQKKPRKNYKKLLPQLDRPRRSGKQLFDLPKAKSHLRCNESRVLPQWWKDTMTEVMIKKKAIAEGKDVLNEVPITEDPDFIDTGNYSDDEWLLELRKEEMKREESEKNTSSMEESFEEERSNNMNVNDDDVEMGVGEERIEEGDDVMEVETREQM